MCKILIHSEEGVITMEEKEKIERYDRNILWEEKRKNTYMSLATGGAVAAGAIFTLGVMIPNSEVKMMAFITGTATIGLSMSYLVTAMQALTRKTIYEEEKGILEENMEFQEEKNKVKILKFLAVGTVISSSTP